MSKQKLKNKVKKLRIENMLLRSDLLVENERLNYRINFAESQVRTLIRENSEIRAKLKTLEKDDVRHAGEVREVLKISIGAPITGTCEHTKDITDYPQTD